MINLAGCPPESFINTDELTILLGSRMHTKSPIYVVRGSRQALAERGLQPAETVSKAEALTVKLNISNSAAGQMVHAAVVFTWMPTSKVRHLTLLVSLEI